MAVAPSSASSFRTRDSVDRSAPARHPNGVDTSLIQTMGLIGGLAMFVGWVLSDLLEEQLIGTVRRDRQRTVRRAAKLARASSSVKAPAATSSPSLRNCDNPWLEAS